MGKLIACVLACMLVACDTPKKVEPIILSVPNQIVSPYRTRLNIVMFNEQTKLYPNITTSVKNALNEWAIHLPIEIAVLDTSIVFANRLDYGVISIQIEDIQQPPLNMPNNVLGCWLEHDNVLALDIDLEDDGETTYSVSLHEIGHALGLPHVVSPHMDEARTGDIVLNSDADSYVMFPYSSILNSQSKLSELEIEIATKKLLDLKRLVNNDCLHLTAR